jgi:MFS family permease
MSHRSGHFAAALSERPFALFIAGQFVSQFGDYLAQIALIGVVGVYTTRAPLAYSQLTVAIALPALLFGPIIGTLVDRRPKRSVLMASDGLRAVIIGLIPLAMKATGSVLVLFPMVFASFLLGLFASSARYALIPSLVPPQKIFAANAVMNFVNKLAGVLGFAGGGFLVVGGFWRGLRLEPWEAGFYLDSLTFLASVATVALLGIREDYQPRERESDLGELWRRRIRNFKEDQHELLSLVRSQPLVRFTVATLLLVALFGGTLYPLIVVIVQKGPQIVIGGELGIPRIGATHRVGFLGGVLAVGMMLGSLSAGFLFHRLSRRAMVVAGLAVTGVLMSLFALSRQYWEFLPVALLAGFFLSPVMIAQDTLLHESAPESIWGRVFSGRDIILNGGFMLSSLLLGMLAQLVLPLLGTVNHERVALFWAGMVLAVLGLATLTIGRGRKQ